VHVASLLGPEQSGSGIADHAKVIHPILRIPMARAIRRGSRPWSAKSVQSVAPGKRTPSQPTASASSTLQDPQVTFGCSNRPLQAWVREVVTFANDIRASHTL
jgi:hypothetical protein